jgi:hypothetical protein
VKRLIRVVGIELLEETVEGEPEETRDAEAVDCLCLRWSWRYIGAHRHCQAGVFCTLIVVAIVASAVAFSTSRDLP